jgi:hypothetical protein
MKWINLLLYKSNLLVIISIGELIRKRKKKIRRKLNPKKVRKVKKTITTSYFKMPKQPKPLKLQKTLRTSSILKTLISPSTKENLCALLELLDLERVLFLVLLSEI